MPGMNMDGPRARGRLFRAGALALVMAVPASLGAAQGENKAAMELGRKVFTQIAQPSCGICHTLVDAGTKGEVGAKLEEILPDESRVMQAVRQGSGVMPRYDDKLTKEQIEAVAYYVSRAARRGK